MSLKFTLALLATLSLALITQPIVAQDAEADDPAPAADAQPEAPADEPAADDAAPPEETPADPPATDDAPAADAPDDQPPADPAPAVEPPTQEPAVADDNNAAAAFDAKLEEWKALLKEMRTLQETYRQADDAELPALREQWNVHVERGRAMLPELRDLGMAAFKASPGTDRKLSSFLAKMARDAILADRWQIAHELSTTLLAAKVDDELIARRSWCLGVRSQPI